MDRFRLVVRGALKVSSSPRLAHYVFILLTRPKSSQICKSVTLSAGNLQNFTVKLENVPIASRSPEPDRELAVISDLELIVTYSYL